MKLEKFMAETAKALLKENKVAFWEYGDKVVITNDGFMAIVIPKEKNIFNCKYANGNPIPSDWDSAELWKTDELKQLDKKTTIRIFKTKTYDNKKICLNDKLVKYFDDTAVFYGQPKKAVYVAEDGVLCGMIMPFSVEV